MPYFMKSPLALYRAFRAANVPDDLAREAAFAVSADWEAVLTELLTGPVPGTRPGPDRSEDLPSPR